MTRPPVPRYFICRDAAGVPAAAPDEGMPPAHLLDSFFVGHRHLEERRWAVAVDGLGYLRALPCEDRRLLPAGLRSEFAFHEMSGGQPPRLLEAVDVFLFNLQLLEQPAGSPGWNDPVYLYGTLYGPLPAGTDGHPAGVEGQLMVTRGDVLDGLARGAGHAFRYTGLGGTDDQVSRCFHAMLPGGDEEDLRRGEGVVVAYPLLPAELSAADASNEVVVEHLLYDLLGELKEDLTREQTEHPLRTMVLPVPDREALERQLQAQGYAVKGDRAVKKAEKGEGFRGVLASVFGALMSDELELPPEGGVDEFLSIARHTLASAPGWPSPRGVALQNCVKAAPARRGGLPATPPPIRTERPSAPRRPARRTARPDGPPAWMRDFIAAHREPGAPPPRLTSTAPRGRKEPGWLKDFEESPAEPAEGAAKKKRTKVKPEWMKDFE